MAVHEKVSLVKQATSHTTQQHTVSVTAVTWALTVNSLLPSSDTAVGYTCTIIFWSKLKYPIGRAKAAASKKPPDITTWHPQALPAAGLMVSMQDHARVEPSTTVPLARLAKGVRFSAQDWPKSAVRALSITFITHVLVHPTAGRKRRTCALRMTDIMFSACSAPFRAT